MNGRFHDDEITNAVNQMTAVPYTVVSLHVELELKHTYSSLGHSQ